METLLELWRELILVGMLLGLVAVPSIINKRKPAVSTIAWVLALVLLPYVGLIFYIFIGHSRLKRRLRRRQQANSAMAASLGGVKHAVDERRLREPEQASGLAPLCRALIKISGQLNVPPVTSFNHVKLLEDGSSKFPLLLERLERARDHIHLLYYTFETDETGTQLRDLLVKKAREGVTVRVLWDAVGSVWASGGFFDELEAAGGQSASFLPVRLTLRRLDLNFRNHRKIVVIDGEVGFTGGMNVGNEYSGLHTTAWHDIHLMIEGPAVHDLQEVFAEDWYFATHQDLVSQRYFPGHRKPGDEVVQIVPSGPDHDWATLHQLYFAAITGAQDSVVMTTPYFVPTESLLSALTSAAQRGVDVRVMVPQSSDQPLAWWAGRSYYRELLVSGVRIFEYTRSVLHAKVMSVDGLVATVGSCNLDVRSFYLNFELNAVIYSSPFASELEALVRRDMAHAEEVKLEAFAQRPWRQRLLENACRLLSPVL